MSSLKLDYAALALGLVMSACSSVSPRVADPTAPVVRDSTRGKASWYGKRFHRRPTASGERFDMNALTAAHRTLPFGSKVRVRNLANDSSVVVRINDRGPYAGDRLIDLSFAAAKKIGMLASGVAQVEIEKP